MMKRRPPASGQPPARRSLRLGACLTGMMVFVVLSLCLFDVIVEEEEFSFVRSVVGRNYGNQGRFYASYLTFVAKEKGRRLAEQNGLGRSAGGGDDEWTRKRPLGPEHFRRVVPHVTWESESEWPHPRDFHRQFMDTVYDTGSTEGGPVLMKGAARSHPAFEKWTLSYLNGIIGNHTVKVEHLGEDRCSNSAPSPSVVDTYAAVVGLKEQVNEMKQMDPRGRPQPAARMEWDGTYHRECPKGVKLSTADGRTLDSKYVSYGDWFSGNRSDAYIISELDERLHADVLVPSPLLCGHQSRNRLSGDAERSPGSAYEVDFWVSNPREGSEGSSVFHFDMNHAVMCLYSGRKD